MVTILKMEKLRHRVVKLCSSPLMELGLKPSKAPESILLLYTNANVLVVFFPNTIHT